MASQAEIDTAAAKAKQNNNNQAAKDTAKAKSKQNGGDGGTAADFSAREAAAGLNLSGNNTTSGRGEIGPTFSQREANAGLTLAGNDTTAGRDDFYSKPSKPKSPWASFDSKEMQAGSNVVFQGDVPSSSTENYMFKVVNNGDGSIKVLAGSVNTIDVAENTPAGQPTDAWLVVTVDASDGSHTAAALQASNPGADTTTRTSRKVATITWADNVPTITQGIRGAQSIYSCGTSHTWRSLYGG